MKIIIDDLYKNRPVRFYTKVAPAIRAERQGLKVMSCKEFGKLVSEKYSRMHDISRRIYGVDGECPTIHTMQGGNTEIKVAIMNSDKKPICLNSKGGRGGVEGLQPSLTDRIYDSSGISTAITTSPFFMPNYIIEEGGTKLKIAIPKEPINKESINVVGNYSPSGHDASRIVHPDGIAPTVKENHGTVTATLDMANVPHTDKPFIVASRGRNPENPSDRTAGIKLEQRLEPNTKGLCNTLTSVQKDNYVAEPLALDEQNGYIRTDGTVGTIMTDGSSPKHNNRVVEPKWISEKGVNYICDPKRGMCTDVNADVAQTITAVGQSNWTGSFVSPDIERLEKSKTIGTDEPTKIHLKNGNCITSNNCLAPYRIRKLTPKECWRLMAFTDEDFEKASAVCSNTQLYKQAGNSIVVNVLMAIFWELLL